MSARVEKIVKLLDEDENALLDLQAALHSLITNALQGEPQPVKLTAAESHEFLSWLAFAASTGLINLAEFVEQ